jgi:hypothetical protein
MEPPTRFPDPAITSTLPPEVPELPPAVKLICPALRASPVASIMEPEVDLDAPVARKSSPLFILEFAVLSDASPLALFELSPDASSIEPPGPKLEPAETTIFPPILFPLPPEILIEPEFSSAELPEKRDTLPVSPCVVLADMIMTSPLEDVPLRPLLSTTLPPSEGPLLAPA